MPLDIKEEEKTLSPSLYYDVIYLHTFTHMQTSDPFLKTKNILRTSSIPSSLSLQSHMFSLKMYKNRKKNTNFVTFYYNLSSIKSQLEKIPFFKKSILRNEILYIYVNPLFSFQRGGNTGLPRTTGFPSMRHQEKMQTLESPGKPRYYSPYLHPINVSFRE